MSSTSALYAFKWVQANRGLWRMWSLFWSHFPLSLSANCSLVRRLFRPKFFSRGGVFFFERGKNKIDITSSLLLLRPNLLCMFSAVSLSPLRGTSMMESQTIPPKLALHAAFRLGSTLRHPRPILLWLTHHFPPHPVLMTVLAPRRSLPEAQMHHGCPVLSFPNTIPRTGPTLPAKAS